MADGVRVVTEVSTASPPVVSVSFVGTLYDGLPVSVSAATPGSCTGYAGSITAATYTQVCVCVCVGGGGGGGGGLFKSRYVRSYAPNASVYASSVCLLLSICVVVVLCV